jgi:anti-sigma-K factor RskA
MRYLSLGQEAAEQAVAAEPVPSIEERLAAQAEALARIERATAETLWWRKVATGAAIAGALFAAVRLTDIWLAVKRRKREK